MVVLMLHSSAMHQPTLWAMVEEPAPPRAPTKAMTRPIGCGAGIQIKAGDHFDQLQRRKRRHQIFGRAAAHQFAVKLHVVDAADHHHLGGGIADLGQPVEFVQRRLAVQLGFHDQEIGRDLAVYNARPPR